MDEIEPRYRVSRVLDFKLEEFINEAAAAGWGLHSVVHTGGVSDTYLVITERV